MLIRELISGISLVAKKGGKNRLMSLFRVKGRVGINKPPIVNDKGLSKSKTLNLKRLSGSCCQSLSGITLISILYQPADGILVFHRTIPMTVCHELSPRQLERNIIICVVIA